MALETLKNLEEIGGYKICRGKPDIMTWDEYDQMRKTHPISIVDNKNIISFQIQNGPIKEVGVNGCQIDTMIHVAMKMIMVLNEKYPCEENDSAIDHLDLAIYHLQERKKDREKRGVEGTNQL